MVFLDEAGTSQHEPVSIVAGIVVDADKQLLRAEALAREVLGGVPQHYRSGFTFHAADVWSDPKYRDGWSMAARKGLINRMMSIPRRLGLPIVLGMVRRNAGAPKHETLSMAQVQHMFAFGYCVTSADRYIRDYCGADEVGTLVAEDVPEMRRSLNKIVNFHRENHIIAPPEWHRRTLEEERLGYLQQEGDYRVSRIRGSVHFVEKNVDPMTQIADALAFGFRRCLAGESFGDEFCNAILGRPLVMSDYEGPASSEIFRHVSEF